MPFPWRTAIVTAALGVLASAGTSCRPASRPTDARAQLAAAVANTLPFEARLSGGFAPSAHGAARASGVAPALSPDARIAIALLDKRATDSPTPQARADLGVGYLVHGDVDGAIALLDDAAIDGDTATAWSDLSAAYLVKAGLSPERHVELLARALEAAERSLAREPSHEARFNRALARDGLAAFTASLPDWGEYIAAEPDPGWRDAAARHAADDSPVPRARDQWEARRRELPGRLANSDTGFVNETVRLHPEAGLEFFEQHVLAGWARAAAIGDASGAQAAVGQARLLAEAIHAASGDEMPRDETAGLSSGAVDLARAHLAYSEGVVRYDANDLPAARRLFLTALDGFTRRQSPYRAWALAQLAGIEFQEGAFAAAERRLEDILQGSRGRRHVTVAGRALWLRGLVYSRQWRLTEALTAFREAAARFEQAGQREYAVSLYHHLADTLRSLGEQHDSWVYIGRTLDGLPLVRKPLRRYLLLYNAALFASSQDLLSAALLFQDATVREAEHAGADVLIEATIQRALVHLRRGDPGRARSDLDAVTARLSAIPAGAFKSYVGAELEIVRAQLDGSSAADGLRRAIGFFDRAEPARIPRLYLMLARTPAARASTSIAEAALQAGIERLEDQQAGLGDEALKISYFDESWALFQDMVMLQVASRGDAARAFEYAERSRARALLAATQGTTRSRTRRLSDIQARVPAHTVLVHYATLADRLLIWTITRAAVNLVERRVDQRALAHLVEQHRAALLTRRENPGANDRLYDWLIQPVAGALTPTSTVVLVPDGQLLQLPFATLRHPSTRRYIIEDHQLLVTPSATFYADTVDAAARRTAQPLASALLVGNPTATGATPLPGAQAEAAAAAALYARHELLVGRAATKQRFVELAPGFDVVHFGGHALVNPEFPLLSRLVLADADGAEQSLFAHEISRLRFPRTRLVVLAACSTAAGAVSRGEGAVSVARPFLAGGVPLVVASQWDVDDRATEYFSLALHREIAGGHEPVAALRAAQLAMLRSGNSRFDAPQSWGAFVAVGATAP